MDIELVRLPPLMSDWLGPDYITKEELSLRGYDLPCYPSPANCQIKDKQNQPAKSGHIFVSNIFFFAYNYVFRFVNRKKQVIMAKDKITILGAGKVGATIAHIAAGRQLGDIVLLDVIEGLAEGKALDIAQAGPVQLYDSNIIGTREWEKTADSNIVIITSGVPRKPGMSRDQLLATNVQIVRDVSKEIARYSPESIVVVVSNPLDAMVYTAAKVTGLAGNRVMGMAGALDAARFSYFIAKELGVSAEDIKCVLMGGHGDDMVPLPRFTSAGGIPVTELLDENKIAQIIEQTRKGGIEIVNLLGYSAYYAPAAGAVKMAEAILKDKKTILSCCAYCDREYSVGGYFVGVPVILGKNGVEKVIELDLTESERAQFESSLAHVKELVTKVDEFL
jgi:malate dehydrogenase